MKQKNTKPNTVNKPTSTVNVLNVIKVSALVAIVVAVLSLLIFEPSKKKAAQNAKRILRNKIDQELNLDAELYEDLYDDLGLSRGYNDNIRWFNSMKNTTAAIKEEDKPALILFTKNNCTACDTLKGIFNKSPVVERLSDYFVMTNLLEGEEFTGKEFAVDGAYFPRIYFLDRNGKVNPEINNKHKDIYESYKHYYYTADAVVAVMKDALSNLTDVDPEQAVKEEEEQWDENEDIWEGVDEEEEEEPVKKGQRKNKYKTTAKDQDETNDLLEELVE
ncbi:thioredoxin domain-containing protein [Acrasis kona]|uniref:Thioredoxin domain-containing protein n=1 Tax=Acrasis kona TaxID=1008807 RepID=A0AAW2ZK60_9EUKA